ncbi:bolA family protein [Tieghemostelium lacteum]|uniref:BolA family protein n=1 Tax=Tieghemostelium lacteum TaxID=361077 RepID=A0A152A324_TIELA|nr:bolA family protein [Tieghemostelium lacteum]|eukprot:KYR00507.1 bolA family protein [Tieghemostelium lacteum]
MNHLKLLRCFSTTTIKNTIQSSIEKKLLETFKPTHLEILNESYMHSVPKNSETHFKVVIVSEAFVNKSMLSQHRLVNEILSDELKSGVHALSIHTSTPENWNKLNVSPSPSCMGGSKRQSKDH